MCYQVLYTIFIYIRNSYIISAFRKLNINNKKNTSIIEYNECKCNNHQSCDDCYVNIVIDTVEKGYINDNWRSIPINISTNK
jgi:hypothetical protein